jgi:hypothetical protein
MTKVATIDRRRFVSLVIAAAMVIATVMAMIVPRVTMAAENEGIGGSFTIGNEAPTLTEAATLYNDVHLATRTQMTPQTEYSIKVTVADTGTMDDLNTVVVKIAMDGDNDDDYSNLPAADTQTSFVMTCTVGGANGAWTHNPSSSTTWDVVEANCLQPALTGGSGIFWFNFIPGKVATEDDDWDVYVVVTDDSAQTDTYYDVATGDYDMMWYGEIDVTTGSVGWGSVLAGMDFSNANADQTVAVNYKSNGNYDAAVAVTDNWTGATLNTAGTPTSNQFSVKAWSSDNLTASGLVTTIPGDCVIDNSGDLTVEGGDTNSANTLYLKLGTPFVDGGYSGTITFYIRNRA